MLRPIFTVLSGLFAKNDYLKNFNSFYIKIIILTKFLSYCCNMVVIICWDVLLITVILTEDIIFISEILTFSRFFICIKDNYTSQPFISSGVFVFLIFKIFKKKHLWFKKYYSKIKLYKIKNGCHKRLIMCDSCFVSKF